MLIVLDVIPLSDLNLTKLDHSQMRIGQTQNHLGRSRLGTQVRLISRSTLGFITEAGSFFAENSHNFTKS